MDPSSPRHGVLTQRQDKPGNKNFPRVSRRGFRRKKGHPSLYVLLFVLEQTHTHTQTSSFTPTSQSRCVSRNVMQCLRFGRVFSASVCRRTRAMTAPNCERRGWTAWAEKHINHLSKTTTLYCWNYLHTVVQNSQLKRKKQNKTTPKTRIPAEVGKLRPGGPHEAR